jgi:hypothetical protein
VISNLRPHQWAATNNRRSMILICPARRIHPASPQFILELSSVGAVVKTTH